MRHVVRSLVSLSLLLVALPLIAQAPAKHKMTIDDIMAMRDVSHPRVSPDGKWVAYSVRSTDMKADRRQSDIWMTSWDSAQTLQLTFTKDQSESSPQWSPDGKYLAFLSSREDENDAAQVWLLDRQGGEARKLTEFKGGVDDFVFSPDGKRLALVVTDPDPAKAEEKKGEKKTPPPIVIDRYYFKDDSVGYVTARRDHLYVLDVATGKSDILTPGNFDEKLPAWSPDGSEIVFVSKRTGADPDRNNDWNLFVIGSTPGSALRQLTTFDGPDNDTYTRPVWSPDGKSIAYIRGGAPKLIYYGEDKLAVIPSAGGTPKILTSQIDNWVSHPEWSADGKFVYFILEDDRTDQLERIAATGGTPELVSGGRVVIRDYTVGPKGEIAVLRQTPTEQTEVFAVDGDEVRALSHQNDDLMASLELGATQETSFHSKDGTEVHGFIVTPPDYQKGKRYPTILRVHGGPVGQFSDGFNSEWQLFAANGYVVVAANPRGSSGRGQAYSTAIYADWGNKDVQDVLAAVDDAVKRGIADPARLGIGGWSYGGMLTNYTIARDQRFKAATSGASIANVLAGWGTDEYVREYVAELGVPWANVDTWMRCSYPFYHAPRITTPTLFLGGTADFNVPLLNGEQMYQSLKQLNVPTELIIYPGQHHGLTKPSYIKDRLQRYLDWYAKYIPKEASASEARSR